MHTISKLTLPTNNQGNDNDVEETKPRSFRMFHDDTMRSFFRRLAFRYVFLLELPIPDFRDTIIYKV